MHSQIYIINSPNQRLKIEVGQESGKIHYSLFKDNKIIINKSFMELFNDSKNLLLSKEEFSTELKSVDETWQQVWGQNKLVRNNYNQLSIVANNFNIIFRLFDDGLGFRYELKGCGDINFKSEATEFNIDKNSTAWWIPALKDNRYEYLYKKDNLHNLPLSHTPLTIKLNEDTYISIHEASLYDFGSMNIAQTERGLVSSITPLQNGYISQNKLPFNLPWRVVLVADSAVGLLDSELILNLNEPSKIEDISWIRPTKFLGIWWSMHLDYMTWESGDRHGATTQNALKYINFCHKLGIKSLLIEGWNEGWDGNWLDNSDKMKHLQPYPDFDIHLITNYAKTKNVEIIGHHETVGNTSHYEYELPEAYEYYRQLGVNYVKTGYANKRITNDEFHHSQIGVNHYQKTVELAAKNKIMLNIHEPIKGTGIERTWPNILTREGAITQEYGDYIPPEHTTILPFTRMLAGPLDYSSGLFKLTNLGRKGSMQSTLAKQLAYYLTLYSPMQMVSDIPENYVDHPAFEFIKKVPVNWERTIHLDGEIGEFYVVARKDIDSDDWYIGGITNQLERELSLNLDFLDDSTEYQATIYKDGLGANYYDNPEIIQIEKKTITKDDHFNIWLASGGGFTAILSKLKK